MLRDNRISINKIIILSSFFVLFIFIFFQYKKAINIRNLNNQYLIATPMRDETAWDKIEKMYLEETIIQEPLTNEEFLQKAKNIIYSQSEPQKIILNNLSNYKDEDSTDEDITLIEVMMVGSPTFTRLLLSRAYKVDEPLKKDEGPFLITSTGELGLDSNTLKYSVEVTSKTDPTQWIPYLPTFNCEIQAANDLEHTKSVVFVSSKTNHFIYDSEKKHQLIEMIVPEME
ncbi:hypothetical protein [Enterococcus lemanii]|uniref:Uncharacterized protein n=1 Tax=Enterococcus lemanii TaxID=1159752 RepID=A0ABV9MQA6_9ENTE|nr:hypothetical protein [Enterococcus lemanii]MBM7710299.1 Ca2+/Na+ antiporter [Enterococcus lemanii]